MLRIHFMQQWFGLSDPAMEEALHDVPLYREFAGLDAGVTRMPDESTILRFRHLLEGNNLSIQLLAAINATLATKGLLLKSGTVVDATLIAAPPSTKNRTGERDPEMHQTKKGNQWHFGIRTLPEIAGLQFMPAHRIIEHLDVIKDIAPCIPSRGKSRVGCART